MATPRFINTRRLAIGLIKGGGTRTQGRVVKNSVKLFISNSISNYTYFYKITKKIALAILENYSEYKKRIKKIILATVISHNRLMRYIYKITVADINIINAIIKWFIIKPGSRSYKAIIEIINRSVDFMGESRFAQIFIQPKHGAEIEIQEMTIEEDSIERVTNIKQR